MSILPEAKLYIDGVLRRAAGDKTYDKSAHGPESRSVKRRTRRPKMSKQRLLPHAARSTRPIGLPTTRFASSS